MVRINGSTSSAVSPESALGNVADRSERSSMTTANRLVSSSSAHA
jgi:hypothetical protein